MPIHRRPFARFVFAVLFTAVLAGPTASRAAQVEGRDEAAASGNPSIAAFETLQAHIAAEVREGRLPAEAGEQATEISFALETALIRADADIQVALLEAKRFSGERQEAALKRLVRAAAERERQVFHHLRRLEEVAGVSAPALVPAAGEKPAKEAKNAKKGKKNGLDFEFKAEDLTKDPEWPL